MLDNRLMSIPQSAPSQTAPAVTPERLMQLSWGYAPPLIIEAAVRNGLFDALATQPMTSRDLAGATGTSQRGVTAVMDALVSLGLAARNREGQYVLTPESDTFLVSSRPGFLGGFLSHMSQTIIPSWLSLSESVRTGEPATQVNEESVGGEFFRDFVEALFPLGYPAALGVAKALEFPQDAAIRILDIAAGSGVWSIGFAKTYPRARVTAVDWGAVIPVTQKVVAQHGLSERYTYISDDILEADFGAGYDVATLGQILHSEGDERSRKLIERVFQALKPGGTIVIAEFVANDDRTGPPNALIFSVNMLVHTKTGRAYTFPEIRAWLDQAGFENAELVDIPSPSIIVARKPDSNMR